MQRLPSASAPNIIPRPEHRISRANISENALKVLYRLRQAGHQAYLVGGGVRDLLLGREPKDFDVVTDANPERVRELFRNCRLIGRRFRLAHVRFRDEIIEVATFRALHDGDIDGEESGDRVIEDGRIVRDNVFGTIEEDAWRRDFSINALFYNIEDFSVVDFVGGMQDLREGVLRVIGDPVERYREDPVRILRAVRFAAKLGFRLDSDSERAIAATQELLDGVPPARLFEEVLKLFLGGAALQTFEMLRRYDLFGHLFPETEQALNLEHDGFPAVFVARALANTDARVAEGKPVTPAFLFAALLWEPVRLRLAALGPDAQASIDAMDAVGGEIIALQARRIAIPRRFTEPMRDIWRMQLKLPQRAGRRALKLVDHPRFRAAYDFLALRVEGGEPLAELVDWWTQFQEADEEGRAQMLKALGVTRRRRRRPRKRRSNA